MGYDFYIVRTISAHGESSRSSVRVSPVAGQGISPDARVSCSNSMRLEFPVGTLFKLTAKIQSKEGGIPFLYSPPHWEFSIISEDEAKDYISKHF